jgi:hypothetical protein
MSAVNHFASLLHLLPENIQIDQSVKYEETVNDKIYAMFVATIKPGCKVQLNSSEWISVKNARNIQVTPRHAQLYFNLLTKLFGPAPVSEGKAELKEQAPTIKPVQKHVDLRRLVVHCKKAPYDV